MRGLMLVRWLGAITLPAKFDDGASCALIRSESFMSRRPKSMKKDSLFLRIGPLRLAFKFLVS